MKKQNYNNYKKYYIPHHFIFLPLMSGLTILGFTNAYNHDKQKLEWLLLGILSFCILYLGIMLRQHYALGNQNRIVRLEFRLRYFEIYGHSASGIENKLEFSQIAALRFANDTEFRNLLTKALSENFDASDIKKSITDWQADNMRV